MKLALVNPNWTFSRSVYFGCRDPHLPLEYGYAKALLELNGHDALVIDAKSDGLSFAETRSIIANYCPDVTVVTTAPTYLFWRCPPPELREPKRLIEAIRDIAGKIIIVGPHASVTPETTLQKLGADAVIRGECEEVLAQIGTSDWNTIPFLHWHGQQAMKSCAASVAVLPPLYWPDASIKKHLHHHHRFETVPRGPAAEVEFSRGCPFACSFCSKEFFRGKFRKRPLSIVMQEIDRFLSQGVNYFYFIDEIFMPDAKLLESLKDRNIKFGIQTRIDLWNPERLELLGQAGCVSIEAGIEGITQEGRRAIDKDYSLTTEELTDRLIFAKQFIAFVQANLIRLSQDDHELVKSWRSRVLEKGIWANDPVPLFPYPGTPQYRRFWGEPDAHAWEKAHAYYLEQFGMCDLQDTHPASLQELEFAKEDTWSISDYRTFGY